MATFAVVDHYHQPVCGNNFAVMMGEFVLSVSECERGGIGRNDFGDFVHIAMVGMRMETGEEHSGNFPHRNLR